MEDQRDDPYPENIQTACKFQEHNENNQDDPDDVYDEEAEPVYWSKENDGCLRPCKILARYLANGKPYYTVEIYELPKKLGPDYCDLSHEKQVVLRTPAKAITLVDKEYTSDQFLANGFRHEIMAPDDMYTDNWMSADPELMGDFMLPGLAPGEIKHILFNGKKMEKW